MTVKTNVESLNMMTLARARRARLAAAMATRGIDVMVLYGNAWQGDYLRYAADFGILEGHGVAIASSDGATERSLDSAPEAERAEAEVPGAVVCFDADISGAVAARLVLLRNRRMAAPPWRLLRSALVRDDRGFALEDGTALLDELLMHKLPAEIDAVRRAAALADDAYAAFRAAVRAGRRQYEIVAEIEGALRAAGCPDNFMIMGSGGKDVLGMAPASKRRIAAGDLVSRELTPALEGYFVQICRTLVVGGASEPQRRAFAVFREALEAGIAAGAAGRHCGRRGARGERCVSQAWAWRLHDEQMDARARARPGAVLRWQAASARGRHHPARAGDDLDRTSQHLSSRGGLHRARRCCGSDRYGGRSADQNSARAVRGVRCVPGACSMSSACSSYSTDASSTALLMMRCRPGTLRSSGT